MFRSIIFDIDGTLINTEKTMIQSFQLAVQDVTGRVYRQQDLRFILGLPGDTAVQRLELSPEMTQEVRRQWTKQVRRHANSMHVFEGIDPLLHFLRNKGVELGVVTSKTREEYENDFKPFGLDHYFTAYICANDTKHHKPHPDPLLRFLSQTETPPEHALYIGDTIYDEKSARAANISFALARWGAVSPEKNQPDFTFATPHEMKEWSARFL